MIRPPSGGMAFTEAADGDIRADPEARLQASVALAINDQWAVLSQVHGAAVIQVTGAGSAGEGDALWTATPNLPVAVMTADCFGVILMAQNAVGVAHAGWRGTSAGVVTELRESMSGEGHPPTSAAIGPGIGACCFEVGSDVADRFVGDAGVTTWGKPSVDLRFALSRQLEGIETWEAEGCTCHEPGWFSHRRNATEKRLATVGWI